MHNPERNGRDIGHQHQGEDCDRHEGNQPDVKRRDGVLNSAWQTKMFSPKGGWNVPIVKFIDHNHAEVDRVDAERSGNRAQGVAST